MSNHTNNNKNNNMEGGAYTGRFNGKDGYVKAQHFIELLDFLHENVENFPETETLWPVLDSESLDERKKKIKKQRKRASNNEEKFKPKNLTKPKQPIHLFRKDYKKDIIENGGKFNTEEFNEAWHNLDKDKRKQYEQEYHETMEQYKLDYEKELQQAIYNGEYKAQKPKQPPSGYIMFCQFCRTENNTILSKDEFESLKTLDIKESTKLIVSKYNEIKDNPDFIQKMNETIENAKLQYEWKMYHWEITCLEGEIRLCERDGKETKYIKEKLDNLRGTSMFENENMPTYDLSWINKFGTVKLAKGFKPKKKTK